MTLDTESLVHTYPNRMTLLNVNIDTLGSLSLISQASLPLKSWDEAFFTTMINRLPTYVLLGEVFFGLLKPNYPSMCSFPYQNHKLSLKSIPSTFIGCNNSHKIQMLISWWSPLYFSSCYFFMNHPFNYFVFGYLILLLFGVIISVQCI